MLGAKGCFIALVYVYSEASSMELLLIVYRIPALVFKCQLSVVEEYSNTETPNCETMEDYSKILYYKKW